MNSHNSSDNIPSTSDKIGDGARGHWLQESRFSYTEESGVDSIKFLQSVQSQSGVQLLRHLEFLVLIPMPMVSVVMMMVAQETTCLICNLDQSQLFFGKGLVRHLY